LNRSRSIALFDQYPYLGGGQIVLLSIAAAARRVTSNIVLYAPVGGALELAIKRRFGGVVVMQPTPEPQISHGHKIALDVLVLLLFSLKFAFRHFGAVRSANLVYANGPRQFPGLMLLSLLTSRRCCYHLHNNHGAAEKRLIVAAARMRSTAKIFVNSQFVYSQLLRFAPELGRNPKVMVLENGLDRAYAARHFLDRFTTLEKPWNLVVLGVLRPEKGQDIAIELARRMPEIHVHLIGRAGPGAEAWVASLRARAPPNVTFRGTVDDVPASLDALDARLNLMPSRWEEPFGLAAIEGMACSCITMVSDRGALPEIAQKTGALVYGTEIAPLVTLVRSLLAMSHRALAELAAAQFDATMRVYHPDRFVDRLAEILAATLAT